MARGIRPAGMKDEYGGRSDNGNTLTFSGRSLRLDSHPDVHNSLILIRAHSSCMTKVLQAFRVLQIRDMMLIMLFRNRFVCTWNSTASLSRDA